jgi:phosphoglycerate dehydrogenase-like enzyme
VILSPHSAGLSKKAAIRVAISTAKNVLAGIDGKRDTSMVVNREVLSHQEAQA